MSDPYTRIYTELMETTGLNIEPGNAALISELIHTKYWDALVEVVKAVQGALTESAMGGTPLDNRDYLIAFGKVNGVELFLAKTEEIASVYNDLLAEGD